MDVSREHIHFVEGARGPKPCIAGTRIRVVDVVGWHDKLKMTPDQILEQFPQLTRADVYAALAYYWDHKEDLDRRMAEDARSDEELMRQQPSALRKRPQRRRLG